MDTPYSPRRMSIKGCCILLRPEEDCQAGANCFGRRTDMKISIGSSLLILVGLVNQKWKLAARRRVQVLQSDMSSHPIPPAPWGLAPCSWGFRRPSIESPAPTIRSRISTPPMTTVCFLFYQPAPSIVIAGFATPIARLFNFFRPVSGFAAKWSDRAYGNASTIPLDVLFPLSCFHF